MGLKPVSLSVRPTGRKCTKLCAPFYAAKRGVSVYINWTASVACITFLIGRRGHASNTQADEMSLPQRPIAFRGVIQLGLRILRLSAKCKASIAIGRDLDRLKRW